jgi:tRNA-2-methylthio-N6-dimethylallyladenosine synthase
VAENKISMISSIPKIGESVHQIAEEKQGEVFGSDYLNQDAVGLKKFYIESYGCQMNFSDSEIVASILSENRLHCDPEC